MATCMQIRLPLACLLIMLYCLALFLRKQRLPTKASRVFSWMGFVAVLNLCAATAMEYAVNNRALVPEGLNLVCHLVFFVTLVSWCGLLLVYLLMLIERTGGVSQRVLIMTSCVICLLGRLRRTRLAPRLRRYVAWLVLVWPQGLRALCHGHVHDRHAGRLARSPSRDARTCQRDGVRGIASRARRRIGRADGVAPCVRHESGARHGHDRAHGHHGGRPSLRVSQDGALQLSRLQHDLAGKGRRFG